MKTTIVTKASLIERDEVLKEFKDKMYFFNVKVDIEAVLSKTKKSDVVFQRALFVAYMRLIKSASYVKIGSYINRDHATALHLTKYNNYSNARDHRYDKIVKELGFKLRESDIKMRILYLEEEVIKLKKLINVG